MWQLAVNLKLTHISTRIIHVYAEREPGYNKMCRLMKIDRTASGEEQKQITCVSHLII